MKKQFWDHLLVTASTIETLSELDAGQLQQLREHMESIEVFYHRSFDPADSYAEYVAVTLCRAINKVLPRS